MRNLSERISFVIPKRTKDSLRELQNLLGEDQSSLLRRLVDKGLTEVKIDIATDNYVKGKTSLEQSSKIAGVSLWRFLDELRKRNIALKYSIADAENEIQVTLSRLRERQVGSAPDQQR